MKRLFAILLVAVLVFSFCACGQAPATIPAAEPEVPADAPAASPDAGPEDPIASQIIMLFNTICQLKTNPDYNKYWYCVTDLDHNGRLEVTAAVTEGTGSFTRAMTYEVAEDMKSLNAVDYGLKEGEYLPEIIKSQTDVYHVAADDSWNYIYFDSTSVDAGTHAQTIESITMKNGKFIIKPLGYTDITTTSEGHTVYKFTDAAGNELPDGQAYLTLGAKAYEGTPVSTANFDWFALYEILSTERLTKSYSVFAGLTSLDVDPVITPIPVYTPSPAPTTTPTPTPTASPTPAPAPVVTKDPTGETVYVGGSCQFVARANNSTSMRWKLRDPNGVVYDATSTPFAGQLGVSGVASTCLTLSNIPIGMNGYTAFAEFYGSTTVQSKAARITVNQKEAPTITASVSSGYTFGQLYNSVNLYSSNGAAIHYECIKSGDSGAYASADIPNGGAISIAGIEGQYITVEVYCSVKGNDKTFYFKFNVDRTPAPTPVEYSEYGTVTGDNFVEVFIRTSSGTYYIEKSACMFGGTGFPSVGDSATVTFRNGTPIIAVINCTGYDVEAANNNNWDNYDYDDYDYDDGGEY